MDQFTLSLITTLLIGGITGYLGTLLLTRRMSLVGGPLGHLALPGVALALLYNFNLFLGALISIGLGAIVIWILSLKSKAPLEALTAVTFASGVAIGFLFLPLEHAEEALIGNVWKIDQLDLVLTIILFILVLFLYRRIYKDVILIELSPDLARAQGINLWRCNLLYLISVALITALEVKIVGILLTAALFAIPAAASREVSKNLSQYQIFSFLFGSIAALIGVLASNSLNLPAGPLIILASLLIFLLSLLVSIFRKT